MNVRSARPFRMILPAVILLLTAAGHTQARPAPSTAGEVVAAAAVAETRTYLKRLEKLGFAGVVLVARGDEPLLAEGFGLADRERGLRWTPGTVSDIGSITKQFTGAAILKLEEDKRLSVDDPITRYFDGVPADKAGITLHQLLTHSSGIQDPDIDDFDAVPLADYLKQVFARPLLFAPGKGYTYANANFSLLGAIIEKLSGESYEAFLRERLFLPAGMYETGYLLPSWGDGRLAVGYDGEAGRWGTFFERSFASDGPHWALRANGGIHMTAYDMLRWARALLTGRVLTPASMKKLWTPFVSEGGGTFYAYGWSIAKAPDGAKIVTHNGGNGIYFADLAIMPDTGLVVFLMTNVIAENKSANSLLEQIGMRFHAGAPYPSIPEAVAMKPEALAPFAGTYAMPAGAGSFELSFDGKALFIEARGRQAFAQLNSVREAPAGRLDKLSDLTAAIIAGNMKGDFQPLFKAYGGNVSLDQLKARWTDLLAMNEKVRGKVQRFEVLGTVRTADRDETVTRFTCERGTTDLTYVWDVEKEGHLLGRSVRSLTVKLRLYPSGEAGFFTWDGGIRPPKSVRIETGTDGKMRLTVGEQGPAAIK
jgi:CubicO group peptidase (beta-lactamase class C family)